VRRAENTLKCKDFRPEGQTLRGLTPRVLDDGNLGCAHPDADSNPFDRNWWWAGLRSLPLIRPWVAHNPRPETCAYQISVTTPFIVTLVFAL
jgi:hypothetical protein